MRPSDTQLQSIRDSVSWAGRLSDSIVRFGPFSLGVDGILSWIPGVGEIYSVLAGAFIVLQGARAGVPLTTLAAATALLSCRTIVSGVPVAGAAFADVFTAHRWAAAMIVRAIDRQRAQSDSRAVTVGPAMAPMPLARAMSW
jgi:hypothetical protein